MFLHSLDVNLCFFSVIGLTAYFYIKCLEKYIMTDMNKVNPNTIANVEKFSLTTYGLTKIDNSNWIATASNMLAMAGHYSLSHVNNLTSTSYSRIDHRAFHIYCDLTTIIRRYRYHEGWVDDALSLWLSSEYVGDRDNPYQMVSVLGDKYRNPWLNPNTPKEIGKYHHKGSPVGISLSWVSHTNLLEQNNDTETGIGKYDFTLTMVGDDEILTDLNQSNPTRIFVTDSDFKSDDKKWQTYNYMGSIVHKDGMVDRDQGGNVGWYINYNNPYHTTPNYSYPFIKNICTLTPITSMQYNKFINKQYTPMSMMQKVMVANLRYLGYDFFCDSAIFGYKYNFFYKKENRLVQMVEGEHYTLVSSSPIHYDNIIQLSSDKEVNGKRMEFDFFGSRLLNLNEIYVFVSAITPSWRGMFLDNIFINRSQKRNGVGLYVDTGNTYFDKVNTDGFGTIIYDTNEATDARTGGYMMGKFTTKIAPNQLMHTWISYKFNRDDSNVRHDITLVPLENNSLNAPYNNFAYPPIPLSDFTIYFLCIKRSYGSFFSLDNYRGYDNQDVNDNIYNPKKLIQFNVSDDSHQLNKYISESTGNWDKIINNYKKTIEPTDEITPFTLKQRFENTGAVIKTYTNYFGHDARYPYGENSIYRIDTIIRNAVLHFFMKYVIWIFLFFILLSIVALLRRFM